MNDRERRTRQYLTGSFICLLPLFYILGVWFYVIQTTTGSHQELRKEFFTFFPSFLHETFNLTGIAILCCAAAASLSFVALPTQNKWLQAIAAIIMGIACLFGAWLLFSLM